MESLTLNTRVNADDKREFEKFCNSVGMTVSTAINLFIKTVLREQKLPFEIRTTSFDEEIYNKLKEAEKEMATSSVLYSSEDVLKSMKDIIG